MHEYTKVDWFYDIHKMYHINGCPCAYVSGSFGQRLVRSSIDEPKDQLHLN